MELTLKREFSYYMLTIYVPTCMLVIVSWFSFWIDPKAVPARVALGVTTLLTMSTKTASISNSLPPVAYTKVRQTDGQFHPSKHKFTIAVYYIVFIANSKMYPSVF